MFVAFYHMTDRYTASFIFSLIIPYWLFKVLFAFLDTPLCYLGVWWLRHDRTEPAPATGKTLVNKTVIFGDSLSAGRIGIAYRRYIPPVNPKCMASKETHLQR